MDFMRFFQSLEELFYEVIVWLVFYPRTFWITLRHPQRMMDHADTELGDVQSEQYTDTLSPPLFLIISMIISFVITLSIDSRIANPPQAKVFDTTEQLLIFRTFSFSLLPLLMSLQLLRKLELTLDRDELRPLFYSQCYVTAPFAMIVGPTLDISSRCEVNSLPIVLAPLFGILFWYLRQQAHWFSNKVGFGLWRGWLYSLSTWLVGIVGIVMLSVIWTHIRH